MKRKGGAAGPIATDYHHLPHTVALDVLGIIPFEAEADFRHHSGVACRARLPFWELQEAARRSELAAPVDSTERM